MLTAAALVSGPPLLVPELAGGAVGETADLREATLAAARTLVELGCDWTVLAAGEATGVRTGTFAGFGVDVVVALDPEPHGEHPDPMLPLPLLIAGWLRGIVAPRAHVSAWPVDPGAEPARCVELGEQLRAELDAQPRPQGLLVVGDGPNTLGAKAPGGPDPRAVAFEDALRRSLLTGDLGALGALDPGLCTELGVTGRAPWQVLAAAFGATPATCTALYAGAPFGVGYLVGTWVR